MRQSKCGSIDHSRRRFFSCHERTQFQTPSVSFSPAALHQIPSPADGYRLARPAEVKGHARLTVTKIHRLPSTAVCIRINTCRYVFLERFKRQTRVFIASTQHDVYFLISTTEARYDFVAWRSTKGRDEIRPVRPPVHEPRVYSNRRQLLCTQGLKSEGDAPPPGPTSLLAPVLYGSSGIIIFLLGQRLILPSTPSFLSALPVTEVLLVISQSNPFEQVSES